MKRCLALTLVLCAFATFSRAQYVIVPIAPPPAFTFNDLWHFTVQGTGSDSSSLFYVSMRIFDGNSQLKLKSNTSVFGAGGMNSYYNASNIGLLQPFTTSYYDGGMLQGVVASGGQFPAGTYNIVFTLFGKFADGEFVPLYEDASQAVVEAMWPPMLLSPPDGDTIDTQYPLLTWTPAFASFYNGLITYTLNLVEILPGQNAYQAIQSNPYYFTQNNIPVTMLNYPPSAQLLDTSKSYAWQVHADGNGSPMGSSEVWQFTFPEGQQLDSVPSNKIYFDIKKVNPFEKYIISDGYLYIRYDEEYFTQGYELKYAVLDRNYNTKNIPDLAINLNRGINRFRVNQCQLNLGSFEEGEYFYFLIQNPKGEKYLLKFYPLANYTCQ